MRPLKFRRRRYVGVPARAGLRYVAFRCAYTPSKRKQGGRFAYVIGPFKTAKAARWAERLGFGNPHFTHVDAAERISKLWKEKDL